MRQKYPDVKMKHESPEEQTAWIKRFVLEEISPLQVFKKQRTGWCRKDVTTAKYRPFGRLVVDLGGWNDPLAIQGATTGCSKALILGKPWYRIHPQTEMLEFIILEDGWQEEFMRCWDETKVKMLSADMTGRGWERLGPNASTLIPGPSVS